LKKEIADKTTSRLTFIEIHEISHPDGRVLLFEIPAAPQGLPVSWDGHYYGRDGESLGPLNLEEIEHIHGQKKVDYWSAGILYAVKVDYLDTTAVAMAWEKYTKKYPKIAGEITEWDIATFLNNVKLTINGKISRSAILL